MKPGTLFKTKMDRGWDLPDVPRCKFVAKNSYLFYVGAKKTKQFLGNRPLFDYYFLDGDGTKILLNTTNSFAILIKIGLIEIVENSVWPF